MKAFVVLGRTLKAVYEELFVVVAVSLLWWAGTLLIVTAAPATMGLHAVANRAANYRRTGTEFFWSEGRRHVRRSWLLYAAILAVGALIPANIWFYSGYANWLGMIAFVWISVLVLYLMVAQYLFPLLNQQTEPDVMLAVRNAALLAVRSPLYSLLNVVFQVALIGLSVLLVVPVLLLTPGLVALAQNFALTSLLQELGLAQEPPTVGRE
jgi:uncharacterized membrane protein YesL